MRHISIDPVHPSKAAINAGRQALLSNAPLIIPTDTVYGIAAAATQKNPAHAAIFALKKRPRTQTLPLLIATPKALFKYAANITISARELAERLWPGATTLVVKASNAVPKDYVAPDGSVALRVPNSPFTQQLIQEAGGLLACTSANIHGEPACTAHPERLSLACRCAVVFSAETPLQGAPSQIIDVREETPHLLRARVQ